MAASPKNPSTLIFWNDLENDEKLKTCSLAAKGLWTVHMLSIAARSAEPGFVLVGDHACRIDDDLPKVLARIAGESPEVIAELLTELVASRTASVDDKGRVYNRRMVRANGISQVRSEAGKRGAEVTNAERQKSGKGVGKRGGKTGGNDPGNHGGKPSGKTTPPDDDLSSGNANAISNVKANAGRQTPGKDIGKGNGKSSGDPLGKSPPSSLLHASCFSKEEVTATESPQQTSLSNHERAGARASASERPTSVEPGDFTPSPGTVNGSHADVRPPMGRPLPDDWEPSAALKSKAKENCDWLTTKIIKARTIQFHAWVADKVATERAWEKMWLSFISQTRKSDFADETKRTADFNL